MDKHLIIIPRLRTGDITPIAAVVSGSTQQYKASGGGTTTTEGTESFYAYVRKTNVQAQKSLGDNRTVTSCSLTVCNGYHQWTEDGHEHGSGSLVSATIYIVKSDGSAVKIGNLTADKHVTSPKTQSFTCNVDNASYVRVIYNQDPDDGEGAGTSGYVKYSATHKAGYGWSNV